MTNYFASNLKYLREKKKIDQQILAEKLNVPRSTLSCWENGLRTPKIEQIQEIIKVLDVDIDIISRDYRATNDVFDELEILFNKNKDLLTQEDKETIIAIIEKRNKQIDEQIGKE